VRFSAGWPERPLIRLTSNSDARLHPGSDGFGTPLKIRLHSRCILAPLVLGKGFRRWPAGVPFSLHRPGQVGMDKSPACATRTADQPMAQ